MKFVKIPIAWLLTAVMLLTVLPMTGFTAEDNLYSIANDYVTYLFNKETGGFSIDTLLGHPQKAFDNNMPLLYKDDAARSNGTSFVSVRIGSGEKAKDYIFGRDYSWGIGPKNEVDVQVGEDGRLITLSWTVEDITIIKKVALEENTDSDITGNVGIEFEVINNSVENKEVGIRMLFDSALGNSVDAPYMVAGTAIRPLSVETEYPPKASDGSYELDEYGNPFIPQQIRFVDSLTAPKRMGYLILKGWMGGITPNKVVVGHWANMANSRYEYTADRYCDFTNYSNIQGSPDSAISVYWDKITVPKAGTVDAEGNPSNRYMGQMLYGVGNFSSGAEAERVGINITTDRLELDESKTAYKNGGEIKVRVEVDNTVDGSVPLNNMLINLDFDEKYFTLKKEGGNIHTQEVLGNEVLNIEFDLIAKKQLEITAGGIYVSLTADGIVDGTSQTISAAGERHVLMPSTSQLASEVQFNQINPETVYTEGEKAVTITGNLQPFQSLDSETGWDMFLIDKADKKEIHISKQNISFVDDSYTEMTFSTRETLGVGMHQIVFRFTDETFIERFGKEIIASKELEVSNNPIFKIKSYGLISLVRSMDGNVPVYDFYTFGRESEYLSFYYGNSSATGEYSGRTLTHNFGADKNAIRENEILLTVKGHIREMEREVFGETKKFWEADPQSDIVINNVLAYKGDTPLQILKDDNEDFVIQGDGLLQVINSISVWRSEWYVKVQKSTFATLDATRSKKESVTSATRPVRLTLGGAGTMLQSLSGFLFDLQYGEFTADWHIGGDGMVTYGISFGGQIGLPVSKGDDKDKILKEDPAKEIEVRDLTKDQEDISDSMNNLFKEDDDDDDKKKTGTTDNNTTPTETDTNGNKKKKSNPLEGINLSAKIDDIAFGEQGEVENGKVVVRENGYIGIDTKINFGLPKDLLGSLVSNAPGIDVSMTINTLNNIYEIDVGVSIMIIECEAVLAFKEVDVNGKGKILPDKIEFYIRDGLMIPVGPPATPLYITGLGGGINGLADTIGGSFSKLPPLTILMYMRLKAINLLVGDFSARVNLEGLSLEGKLTIADNDSILNVEAGLSARWVDPWSINLYGSISVLEGILQGGITVTIADNYFYGYVYAGFYIPDEIPFVGGKQLAGVEAAVSTEFVGANLKICGIGIGVIYYWGENVKIGENVDLSAPPRRSMLMSADAAFETINEEKGVMGYYGTNLKLLSTTQEASIQLTSTLEEVKFNVYNAESQDSMLIEIPFTSAGNEGLSAADVQLIPPGRGAVALTPDDGNGGGNYLVQHRNGQSYLYVTVTESADILSGEWTLKYDNTKISAVGAIAANGVADIAQIKSVSVNRSATNSFDLSFGWDFTSDVKDATSLDIYLTKDRDIVEKIKTSNNSESGLGDKIVHLENLSEIQAKAISYTLPEAFESGTYYAVAMFSTMQGANCVISTNSISFTNPNLPVPVQSVKAIYSGNGNLHVMIEDNALADDPTKGYTHYIVEVKAADGTYLTNNVNIFNKGDDMIFIGGSVQKELTAQSIEAAKDNGTVTLEDTGALPPNKNYIVNVKTLRIKDIQPAVGSNEPATKKYFYGAEIKSTEDNEDPLYKTVFVPEMNKPKLISVAVAGFDATKEYQSVNSGTLTYTFDQDVWMELDVRGQKEYHDDEFKSVWEIKLKDLEDGDYIIDFKAYGKSKDSVTGEDFEGENAVENARLAFTVDTSLPVLSLAQKQLESLEENVTATFGTNVVIADKATGAYKIEGLTENNMTSDGQQNKLTIDGKADGITIGEGGAFSYSGTLPQSAASIKHIIRAEDRAGNASELMVTVVNPNGAYFEHLLLAVNGTELVDDASGAALLSIANLQDAELSVFGVTTDGKKIEIPNEDIEFSVLYPKHSVSLEDGILHASEPGEAAIKAKLKTSTLTTASNEQIAVGLEKLAIVEVRDNTKEDLRNAIIAAQNTLATNADKPEAAKEDLQDAIDAAQAVYDNPVAAPADITNAVTALNNAVIAFNNYSENSGGNSGGGGGGVAKRFNITVEPTENGKVTVSQTKVKSGSSLTINAVPNEGYEVADMIINGKSVGALLTYTIAAVKSDTTVLVTFKKIGEKAAWNPFIDVKENEWFYDVIKSAYENNLMNGMSASLFEPNLDVTRGMFVTVLYRMEGEPETELSTFGDVPADAYYAKAVGWAQKNAVVNGISDTEFAPNASITREQMAAILYRYAQYKEHDVSIGESTNILSYNDFAEISEYATAAIQWACGEGIINGKDNAMLAPKDHATRAETAAMLTRLLNKLK